MEGSCAAGYQHFSDSSAYQNVNIKCSFLNDVAENRWLEMAIDGAQG